MTAKLTLDKFFDVDFLNVGYNSSDTHLYRIYLSPGRFATTYTSIAERNNHPDWWTQAQGLKSYMDNLIVSDYMARKDPATVTKFLATLVSTFNLPEAEHMAVTERFYDTMRQIHADNITFENSLRDIHGELH